MPSRGEIRRIKERGGEETDLAGRGGRAKEGMSAWNRAVRRVSRACQGAAMGMLRSAGEWRKRNEETWAEEGDGEGEEWDTPDEITVENETDEEVEEEDIGAIPNEGDKEVGIDGRTGRLILVGAGCGDGREEEVIRVTRGSGLGNPFPYTGRTPRRGDEDAGAMCSDAPEVAGGGHRASRRHGGR